MIRNRPPNRCSCIASASPVGPAPTINTSRSKPLGAALLSLALMYRHLVTGTTSFTRRLQCNSPLDVAAKDRAEHLLRPRRTQVPPRIITMSDLQPFLLAGVLLLAHEARAIDTGVRRSAAEDYS